MSVDQDGQSVEGADTPRRGGQVAAVAAAGVLIAAGVAGAVIFSSQGAGTAPDPLGGGAPSAAPAEPSGTANDPVPVEQAAVGATPHTPEDAEQTGGSDQVEEGSVDAPLPDTVVVLVEGEGWHPSGDLELATTQSLTRGSWVMAEGRDGVVAGSDPPDEVFGLPESPDQQYATIVELLTRGPPAFLTNPDDEFNGATWPAEAVDDGESLTGARLSISPDGDG